MKSKTMYKLMTLLVYCCGFPALLITSIVMSIRWCQTGMYGVGAYAPLLYVLALWFVVGMIKILYTLYYRKRKIDEDSWKVAMIGAVSTLILVFGSFLIFEAILPATLDDATSGTILYENVIEDAEGQHNLLQSKINEFKKKNNIKDDVKVTDKKFQDVFNPIFKSMDKAYNSYDKLAIDIATKYPDLIEAIKTEKMPISVAASLLVKTDTELNKSNHNLTIDEILVLNKIEVSKALSEVVRNMNNITDPKAINDILNQIIIYKEFDGVKWNIFQILGNNPFAPDIDVNENIVKTITTNDKTEEIALGSSLGYQDMAWINGIGQMFFIPLMAFRNIMFIFSVVIVIESLIVGTMKKSYVALNGEQMCLYREMKSMVSKKKK